MRNKAGISLLLMMALIFHILSVAETALSQNESENNTPLVTRIVSVALPVQSTDVGFNEFHLDVVAEVWNTQASEITVDYPEACGFGAHIQSLTLNRDSVIHSGMLCRDAPTPMVFLPGLTQMVSSLIFFSESNSNSLPNGDYVMTYGNPNSGLSSDFVSFIKTNMNVTNCETLISNEPLPDGWGSINSQQNTNSPEEQANPNTGELEEVDKIIIDEAFQVEISDDVEDVNENKIIDNNVVNEDLSEVTAENVNINLTHVFLTLFFIIGTIGFTRSKL